MKNKKEFKLANCKMYVGDKTRDIQQKLFEMGYYWLPDDEETLTKATEPVRKVMFESSPFIFIQIDGELVQCCDMEVYRLADEEELTYDELLTEYYAWKAAELCKLPTFKPYDKVLVRDDDTHEWVPTMYSFYSYNDSDHNCMGMVWTQCIIYEGNEHLVGTNGTPSV